MRCPYPKPSRFSDPFQDWDGCEKRLAAILAKNGDELNLEDFSAIFQSHLPAADYEEGCYYVPDYIKYLSQTSGLEERVCEGFFWYIDHFSERFRRDGLLQDILDELWKCFAGLTSSFAVIRLSDAELEKNGIAASYREIAVRSRSMSEFFEALTRWPVFDPIIDRLRDYFEKPLSEEAAHWYYEMAFYARSWLWLKQEPGERFQSVFDYFHRLDRFQLHHDMVSRSSISEGFFQYNRRLSPS